MVPKVGIEPTLDGYPWNFPTRTEYLPLVPTATLPTVERFRSQLPRAKATGLVSDTFSMLSTHSAY